VGLFGAAGGPCRLYLLIGVKVDIVGLPTGLHEGFEAGGLDDAPDGAIRHWPELDPLGHVLLRWRLFTGEVDRLCLALLSKPRRPVLRRPCLLLLPQCVVSYTTTVKFTPFGPSGTSTPPKQTLKPFGSVALSKNRMPYLGISRPRASWPSNDPWRRWWTRAVYLWMWCLPCYLYKEPTNSHHRRTWSDAPTLMFQGKRSGKGTLSGGTQGIREGMCADKLHVQAHAFQSQI
jgi:hypothetical protein